MGQQRPQQKPQGYLGHVSDDIWKLVLGTHSADLLNAYYVPDVILCV